MTSDKTQQQSSEEREFARERSRESTQPPSTIPGYRIKKFLGQGAYGEVWSAVNLKTSREVAIKFYAKGFKADVSLLAQEVEKLAVLSADRYVVQLLDVGWDADPPYYVMEYIEHGSLEDRLREGQSLPTGEAVDLFREIATGMMHLHSKGILHCDLKPGNVLLDQDGHPRVADFGQSRLKSERTSALGTLFYMAPEQADTEAIPDAGWDVYALGALLYCMLTGKPPYYSPELSKEIAEVSSIHERLATYRNRITEADLPTDHRSVNGVDRMLAEIIDRCIAADPKVRFSSIQSVLLALRQREMVRARRPIMLLGLLGPLLLIGVASLFGWWAFSQATSRAEDAVRAKAMESNQFAAKLAARSAAEQIDEYFRVVSQLANDQSFTDLFDIAMADSKLKDLRLKVADPRFNTVAGVEANEEMREIRKEFIENEARSKLQLPLEKRLKDLDNLFPAAASWFVCDRYGNQLASAFRGPNLTLGSNFAYRTYFTGAQRDLDVDDPRISDVSSEEAVSNRPIIDRAHLSAVFVSKQSKTWKVAFSAPIVRYGEVQGVVAVTVDLGEFVEFANSKNQYAMLVDGRPGEFSGAILEHPLFTQVVADNGRLSDDLAQSTIDLNQLEDDSLFYDPVAKTALGAQDYGNAAIAFPIAVMMQGADRVLDDQQNTKEAENEQSQREETGLYVIAVQDYENILSDVRQLGTQLGRLAILAALLLLAVAIGMWFFVNRLMRESRERLSRSFAAEGNSWLFEMETLEHMDSLGTLTFGPRDPTEK